MLTVACVCKSGGIYTWDHVRRLEQQVAEHLLEPYEFIVLSDTGGITLRESWPGWWSKIELFRPGLFKGRVLYLDLDVSIVGDLEQIANAPASFTACRNFIQGGGHSKINSSVMAWDAGVAVHIFNNFKPEVMDRLHGDQDWIDEQMPSCATFPLGTCISYKGSGGRIPKSASVAVFHGKPKPWDIEGLAHLQGEPVRVIAS